MKQATWTMIVVMMIGGGAAQGQLMIPDSGTGDRVMLFDDFNGALIDVNWITDVGAVGWVFTTPKESRVVGNEIWVSDQVADAVHRFDMNRNYLSSITAHPAGGVLDNIRGFGTDGTKVWVSVFHSNTALRGIASYDTSGAPLGFFPGQTTTASFFDVEPFLGDLLAPNSVGGNIERWSVGGAFLGNFATGLGSTPQQVEILSDNSVLGISSIAAAGIEGVYHWEPDGSLRRFIDTEILKGAFGEQVPRGAALLGDGNYLVSTSIGVFKYNVAGNNFTQMLGGVDAQYIARVPEPSTLALLAVGAAMALRRRR
jgi:hypothetical protein